MVPGFTWPGPVDRHHRRTFGDAVALQDLGIGGEFASLVEEMLGALLRADDDDAQRVEFARLGAVEDECRKVGVAATSVDLYVAILRTSAAGVGRVGVVHDPHADEERQQSGHGQAEAVEHRQEAEHGVVAAHLEGSTRRAGR